MAEDMQRHEMAVHQNNIGKGRGRRFTSEFAHKIWDKHNGFCIHCNKKLPSKLGNPRKYDIDHHPIPFRDIDDNLCCSVCVKVSDVQDIDNLVATHRNCNRSHRFEPDACCCGHSQCFCPKRKTIGVLMMITMLFIGFVGGFVVGKYVKI